jgi:hypothetical protein
MNLDFWSRKFRTSYLTALERRKVVVSKKLS